MSRLRCTIEEMQEIARGRGGVCLSTNYTNSKTKLRWQCKSGHRWKAAPNRIKRGSWCPACARLPRKWSLERAQNLARERDGMCLSTNDTNCSAKLRWQCGQGHQWEATIYNIALGRWCPACAGVRKSTIEEMQEIAGEHGGACLSTKYVNACTKLGWQCKRGHRWEATPNGVKKGRWCPVCARKQKLTIEQMQEIAGGRGGACLSTNYINTYTKLRWQCAKGHQWEAGPGDIKRGTWCPVCAGKQKLTIEEMQRHAGARRGVCLSTQYVSVYSSLRWQCREGHQWEAVPARVMRGSWCPVCKGAKVRTTRSGPRSGVAPKTTG